MQLLFFLTEKVIEPSNFIIFVNAWRLMKSTTLFIKNVRLSETLGRGPQPMTNFLAFAPHSVCNGAVKAISHQRAWKRADWILTMTVVTWAMAQHPTIGHRPWLVAMQRLQPEAHLGPKQGNKKLKIDSLYIIWVSLDLVAGNMHIRGMFSPLASANNDTPRVLSLWSC